VVFQAEDIPVYRDSFVTEIALYWYPDGNTRVLADRSQDQKNIVWKVVATGQTKLAGFHFEIFRTPMGFQETINQRGRIAQSGLYALEVLELTESPRSKKMEEHLSDYREFSGRELFKILSKTDRRK